PIEAAAPAILADVARRLDAGVFVRRIGPEGQLWASSAAPGSESDAAEFGDRDYFNIHRELPGDSLFISEVLVSRLNGRPSVVFSRRVETAGRFNGVLTVSMPIGVLQASLETFQPAGDAAVFVATDAGQLVARSPRIQAGFGQQVLASDGAALAAMRARRLQVTMEDDSLLQGRRELLSVRRVENTAWLVGASEPVATALITWRRQALLYGAVLLVLATGIALVVMRLTAALLAASRHQDELQLAYQQLDLAQGAKNRFLTAISHEVRTPLNGVSMAVQLWQRDSEADERSRRLSGLAALSIQRLERSLSDLFDYAQLLALPAAAGASAGAPAQPVTLAPLLQPLHQAGLATAEASSAWQGGALAVQGDGVALTALLHRLVALAIDLRGDDPGASATASIDDGEPSQLVLGLHVDAPRLRSVDLAAAMQPFAPPGLTESVALYGLGVRVETARVAAEQAGARFDAAVPQPGVVQLRLHLTRA
ncbi:MAG: histidine kinase dimerization/phospho-acceptor domain-containing protein, partial [Rubrivivax sp.]|nr:histidine kinase dimerization/phospho-acceptor domain-containing protein [Rubrivivax sp.]